MTPIVIDCETHGILSRPHYPPEPIGVSLKEFGQPAEYLAWGHKTNNNTTKEKAVRRLKQVTKGRDILCHNYAFDIEVLEKHCGIPLPHWSRSHDTMWILFLHDPNMKSLGLKQSAEEILGWPADERDAVREWLLENQPVPGVKIRRGPKNEHYYMKYLAEAPGDLVGKYANGDVERTEALFEKLHPSILKRGMEEAYNRERRLLPVLLESEKNGVRVDLPKLRADVAAYAEVQNKIEAWLRKKLNQGPLFNLDSDAFVDALVSTGLADVALMGLTKTGKVATNKEAIASGVTDKQVAAVIQYRQQLHTCQATFMQPWLATAEQSGGLIYTTWNQVRGEGRGARTGRLSSSPNLQNLPKSFKPLFQHEQKNLPKSPIKGLLPLPKCRAYVIPYEDDHVLIDSDFSQQEIRIMAHFGDGVLLERYRADPWMDAHDTVRADLKSLLNVDISRDAVKSINFGILYGMGIGSLAARLSITVEDAKRQKAAVLALYPEVDDLYKTMRALARSDQPLITWGGREVYCEPPSKDKETGRELRWDFRMVNYLIQASAADATKEALIRYHDTLPPGHVILGTIHDEILASAPRCSAALGLRAMKEAMESLEFDVPLLSESRWSDTSWANLRPYDVRGKLVAVI